MTQPRSPSQPQGSAGDWNVLGGSHSGQSANGSYFPHPPFGFFCEQNLRPMPMASPYQVPAGALGPYPRTDRTMLMVAKKRKALIVCDCQTEYHMLAYKIGINYHT